jgi:hypothetical protein
MDPFVILISILVLATVTTLVLALAGRRDVNSGTMKQRLEAFRGNDQAIITEIGDGEKSHFKQREYSGLPILSAFFGRDRREASSWRAGVPCW